MGITMSHGASAHSAFSPGCPDGRCWPPPFFFRLFAAFYRTIQACFPHLFTWVMDSTDFFLLDVLMSRVFPGDVLRQPAPGCPLPSPGDATKEGRADWLWLKGIPEDPTTAILFMPGGGFLLHCPTGVPFARAVLSRLRRRLGAAAPLPPVLLLRYPLPARAGSTTDCAEDVLRWLVASGRRRVLVAGDSAGGLLAVDLALRSAAAAAVAPRCAEPAVPALAGVVGICPWLDLSLTAPAHSRNARRDILHRRWLALGREAYLRGPGARVGARAAGAAGDALALPGLAASAPALAALRPRAVLLASAEADILADEAGRFAERAAAAGATEDAVLLVKVGGPLAVHDVLLYPGARSPEIDRAWGEVAAYVAQALELDALARPAEPERLGASAD